MDIDPFALRGAERLIAHSIAAALVVGGFILYLVGSTRGKVSVDAGSNWWWFKAEGTGPGFACIVMGVIVEVVVLSTGGVSRETAADGATKVQMSTLHPEPAVTESPLQLREQIEDQRREMQDLKVTLDQMETQIETLRASLEASADDEGQPAVLRDEGD